MRCNAQINRWKGGPGMGGARHAGARVLMLALGGAKAGSWLWKWVMGMSSDERV